MSMLKFCSSSVLALLFVASSGCPFQRVPGGAGLTKISREDIPGTTMWYFRDEDVAWTFTDETVRLENKGKEIPAPFVSEILGEGQCAKSLRASWQLIDDDTKLRLFNLEVDGTQTEREASLPIVRAGNVRINLGSHQYNPSPTDRYEASMSDECCEE